MSLAETKDDVHIYTKHYLANQLPSRIEDSKVDMPTPSFIASINGGRFMIFEPLTVDPYQMSRFIACLSEDSKNHHRCCTFASAQIIALNIQLDPFTSADPPDLVGP